MTREEAIDYNKNLRMYMRLSDKNQPCKFLEENYIALDMAIKALEQEPCADAVSRQVVKEQMIKYGFHAPDMTVTEFVEELPPVTPQQKKIGHWEKIDATHSKCDRCGAVFEITSANGEANYCPNCGAKMESEG